MTGARIEVAGSEEALSALAGIAARAAHPREMFDRVGAALVVSTQHRFETGRGPAGSPWPPSIRALATGGQTLRDTNRLYASLTHDASDAGAEVGTNALYAAVHQFGGVIRPVNAPKLAFKLLGESYFVDEVTIPARPFLGIDEDDEREIVAIAEEYFMTEHGDAG